MFPEGNSTSPASSASSAIPTSAQGTQGTLAHSTGQNLTMINLPPKKAETAKTVDQVAPGTILEQFNEMISDMMIGNDISAHLIRNPCLLTTQFEGLTALMWSIMGDQPGYTNQLIAAGADIDARSKGSVTGRLGLLDTSGQTPLMLALLCQRSEVVIELIKAGANIALNQEQKNKALENAAEKRSMDTVLKLLQAGADPKKLEDSEQDKALEEAQKYPDMKDVVKALEAEIRRKRKYESE